MISAPLTVKHVGITVFDGFALSEAASIMEVFQSANALAETTQCGGTRYDICLLSATGGRIESSSKVGVWTESVHERRHACDFRALFIAGGNGIGNAMRDERLTTWLRRAYPRTKLISPIAEGRLLLESLGFGPDDWGEQRHETLEAGLRMPIRSRSPLQTALSVLESDFGPEVVLRITGQIAPRKDTRFSGMLFKYQSVNVSEKIQASARWLTVNSDRPIAIDDAAQVAAMSERNFLRRFKMEIGLTPSDYLLYVRLDMSCRLLTETTLPVDQIARRCGVGDGGRLSKLFRQHLATTPTDYRLGKRPAGVSS
jgi:transcriptional regulator GlxA family with amidase domain